MLNVNSVNFFFFFFSSNLTLVTKNKTMFNRLNAFTVFIFGFAVVLSMIYYELNQCGDEMLFSFFSFSCNNAVRLVACCFIHWNDRNRYQKNAVGCFGMKWPNWIRNRLFWICCCYFFFYYFTERQIEAVDLIGIEISGIDERKF